MSKRSVDILETCVCNGQVMYMHLEIDRRVCLRSNLIPRHAVRDPTQGIFGMVLLERRKAVSRTQPEPLAIYLRIQARYYIQVYYYMRSIRFVLLDVCRVRPQIWEYYGSCVPERFMYWSLIFIFDNIRRQIYVYI